MGEPLFKFYGSKNRIIRHYPAPQYPVIVEPFAGSASYALQYPDRDVLLAEIDPDVAALWAWLIQATEHDVRSLPIGLPAGLDIRTLDIPHGARLLIRYNQRVGRSRCWTTSKWGHLSGFWDAARRDRVARMAPRIKHWRVVARSMVGWMPRTPATWFIDPPYQGQATVYGPAPDFSILADWCRRLPGQVIVCEAPMKNGELPGWLPFQQLTLARSGPAGKGDGHQQRPELIWTNGVEKCTNPS